MFMALHLQTQHVKATGGRLNWGTTSPGGEPRTYNMDYPTVGGPRNCHVKGCWGRAETRTSMRVHFFHRHVQDTVIILEEVNLTHPRCPWCEILVPWRALNRQHLTTAQ